MKYELAKSLKDAGFPQGSGKIVLDESTGAPFSRDSVIKTPTLSELIEACGYGFRSLSNHSDGRWIAKSGAKTKKFLVSGKTPEIAVAKLWLKINKDGGHNPTLKQDRE